jgi:two-component system sensor histidine kinase AlgZ
MSVAASSAAVLALIAALVALISTCAWLIGRTHLVIDTGGTALFPKQPVSFALRNVWIGLVVTGLALRYFYVAHEWRHSVELRAAARVHALQARIRPHFLFNSMNTIAALTRSDPPRAESAVQDLADLFRATLSDKHNTITLAEELEVARTYQRMEQLRLGKRLEVEWKTDSLPGKALVPGLMIQPLLENAIYHGIEPRSEGGRVTITGEMSGGLITIVVRNPLGAGPQQRDGNRLALANIRERLDLMYGERALMKSGIFDGEYIVTLRFPLVERQSAPPSAPPAAA